MLTTCAVSQNTETAQVMLYPAVMEAAFRNIFLCTVYKNLYIFQPKYKRFCVLLSNCMSMFSLYIIILYLKQCIPFNVREICSLCGSREWCVATGLFNETHFLHTHSVCSTVACLNALAMVRDSTCTCFYIKACVIQAVPALFLHKSISRHKAIYTGIISGPNAEFTYILIYLHFIFLQNP
jgi:hypothetical protein